LVNEWLAHFKARPGKEGSQQAAAGPGRLKEFVIIQPGGAIKSLDGAPGGRQRF